MPTNVADFSLWRAAEGFERAIRSINQADGFNTSPVVQVGACTLESVPAGEFPHVCIEFGDLRPDLEMVGGPHGLTRFGWQVFVYGYVKTTGHRRDLYQAGLALLADVLAAVYANETLPDGAGQGTTLIVEPGDVPFDMESFATDSRGWFAAEFTLLVDTERSATP